MDPALTDGVIRVTIEAATPAEARQAAQQLGMLWPATPADPHPVPGEDHAHIRLYARPPVTTNGPTSTHPA